MRAHAKSRPLLITEDDAMHFLIGFLIVCFIIAVPALRNAALFLLFLFVLWLFYISVGDKRQEESNQNREFERLCVADHIVDLEEKIKNLENSIRSDMSIDDADILIQNTTGIKPQNIISEQNIKNTVLISSLKPNCPGGFNYLINVTFNQSHQMISYGIWVKDAPKGYDFDDVWRDFEHERLIAKRKEEELQKKRDEEDKKKCISDEITVTERNLRKAHQLLDRNDTHETAKHKIERILNVRMEDDQGYDYTNHKVSYVKFTIHCGSRYEYLLNLVSDNSGDLEAFKVYFNNGNSNFVQIESMSHKLESERRYRKNTIETEKTIECIKRNNWENIVGCYK